MKNDKIILSADLIKKYSDILPTTIKSLEEAGSWNAIKTELCVAREKLLDVLSSNNFSLPTESDAPPTGLLQTKYHLAVFRWAVLGLPISKKDDYLERSRVCEDCTFWEGHCALAGESGVKAWLASQECPAKKWPSINTQEFQ